MGFQTPKQAVVQFRTSCNRGPIFLVPAMVTLALKGLFVFFSLQTARSAFLIRNKEVHLCARVSGNLQIRVDHCQYDFSNERQLWEWGKGTGATTKQLVNVQTGKCLVIHNNNEPASVEQCSGHSSEFWFFDSERPIGQLYWNSECLDVPAKGLFDANRVNYHVGDWSCLFHDDHSWEEIHETTCTDFDCGDGYFATSVPCRAGG